MKKSIIAVLLLMLLIMPENKGTSQMPPSIMK